MEAYQQRVVDEANELRERRAKLYAFIHGNPMFENVTTGEQQRMREQLEVMDRYAFILQERINHF